MKLENEIIIVLGKKGHGKSSLIKKRIKDLPRYVVFDPKMEYSKGTIFEDFGSFLMFMERNYKGRYHAVCRFGNDEEYIRAVDLINETGNTTAIIEELYFFLNVRSKPDSFDRLFRYGRHERINIIAINQRASEIPRHFTSQADKIISFKQTEPADLKYLRDTSYIGKEGAERVSNLKKFNGKGEIIEGTHFIVFIS